ncbi:unnamed protein product, partial [Brenthis ino]
MKRSSRISRILAMVPPADSGSEDSDLDLDLSSDAPDIPNEIMDIFEQSDSEDDSLPSQMLPPSQESSWLPEAPAVCVTIPSSPSLVSVNPSPDTSETVQSPRTPNTIYSNTSSPLIPIAPRLLRSRRSVNQNQNNRTEPLSSTQREDLIQPRTFGVEVQRARKRKKERMDFNFRSTKFMWHVDRETSVDSLFQEQVTDIDTPYQYFKRLFDDELMEFICYQSNLYSTQSTGRSVDMTKEEYENFLGIDMLMSIVGMPSYKDYWSHQLRYDKIASVMPLKRYQLLRKYMHFSDNSNVSPNDRYGKVRPVMEHIRKNCLRIEPEKSFSVDEMIIPYKGTRAGSRRQYIKNKPHPWGFKFLVRAGVSGIVYDFFPYAGETTFDDVSFTDTENKYFGLTEKCVLRLAKTIKNPALTTLFFDNWFSSLELISYLRSEFGILSLGVIRKDRLRGCNMISDKDLLKKGRGSYKVMVDNNKKIAVTKWADNKCVTLASSYAADNRETFVKRCCKASKSKVDVTCPTVISEYNQHMGGVDLAGMFVSLYRTGSKSRKWYKRIYYHLVDICVNNSWLVYRRHCKMLNEKKGLSLKDYKLSVSYTLLQKGKIVSRMATNSVKIKQPVVPRPEKDIRIDGLHHIPTVGKKGRCRNCTTGQTVISCLKCETRLCLTEKRNCFREFHTK